MNHVQIKNADCLMEMKNIPDCHIDLTVTSPPYDNLRTYNNSLEWGEHIWKPIIKELYRITKSGGVVVWIVGDATIKGSKTGTSFKQVLYFMSCGFNLHDNMIWKKPNPIPTQSTRYQQEFEYMFVLSKGKPKTFNPIKVKSKCAGTKVKKHRAVKSSHNYNDEGIYTVAETKMIGNVWEIANVKNTSNHPAIFPEQLANYHIISWSNENDIVFDPFMGSGTTGKMALLNNRSFIGIEKDPEYFKIAEKRIKEAQENYQERLF